MPKPPQFFQNPTVAPTRVAAANMAVYQVGARRKKAQPSLIVVECVEGGGNLPRNATGFREITQQLDIEKEFNTIAHVAESILDSLKSLRPGGVEIEFGVELGGGIGIPLITHGEGKANFKIKLTWGNHSEKAA